MADLESALFTEYLIINTKSNHDFSLDPLKSPVKMREGIREGKYVS